MQIILQLISLPAYVKLLRNALSSVAAQTEAVKAFTDSLIIRTRCRSDRFVSSIVSRNEKNAVLCLRWHYELSD